MSSEYWDKCYRDGLYRDEPPMAFAAQVLVAARTYGAHSLLDVGCGPARNGIVWIEAGLDVTGLDISEVALRQFAERCSGPYLRLVHGGLEDLDPDATFDVVTAIHVFQHGQREAAHANIAAAMRRVAPGGLLAVCVESVHALGDREAEVVEEFPDGSRTLQFTALVAGDHGLVHQFSRSEIDALLQGWEPVGRLEKVVSLYRGMAMARWEGIWRRTT